MSHDHQLFIHRLFIHHKQLIASILNLQLTAINGNLMAIKLYNVITTNSFQVCNNSLLGIRSRFGSTVVLLSASYQQKVVEADHLVHLLQRRLKHPFQKGRFPIEIPGNPRNMRIWGLGNLGDHFYCKYY